MAVVDADKRRITPPRQARSQETYDRILDALEALLETRRFEEITVRELVKRSGTSTGSFYARFPTKQTLLPALYDRHDAALHSASAERRRRDEPDEATLEAAVRGIMQRVVERMLRKRWFMRAVSLHARQHPELITDETRRRRNDLHAEWRGQLLRHRDRITHPDPERAVAYGLFMTVTACREKLAFGDAPHAASFELDPDRLVEESARALLAYLGVETTAAGAGRGR